MNAQVAGIIDSGSCSSGSTSTAIKILEASEVPEAGRRRSTKLRKLGDTNKNGKLEADEVRELARHMAASQPGGDPTARFKVMDKNKDNKVSREEFTGVPANFDRNDKNKDGFLDAGEIKTFTVGAAVGVGGGGVLRSGRRSRP